MFIIKAYAESRSGRGQALVSTPTRPTSVQGRVYERYGNAFIGGTGRGRPAGATFVPPRRGRTTRGR